MAALSSAPMLGQDPVVQASRIWSDTVKRGDMVREVRGLGTVKGRRTVELHIAEAVVKEIRAGQQVSIDIREGNPLVGRVSKIDPSVLNGTVPVTVELSTAPPPTVQPGLPTPHPPRSARPRHPVPHCP